MPLVGGVALTALAAYLALLLGAWAFGFRRFTQHEERLRRLARLEPRMEQVVQGLEDEGSRLLASAQGEQALHGVASQRGGPKTAEVLAKGRRWAHTRVFLAGDMVYFIYFDDSGVMRDFTCVSR